MPPSRQRVQLERKLVKKSVKLALEDMKENYAGSLLSAHAVKISSHAPDLAKSISGLILRSDDHAFQEECFSLLGLQSDSVGMDIVENRIREKIVSAIEFNDRKPKGYRHAAPSLFQDDLLQQLDYRSGAYDEGEEDFSFMDC
ncbi:hypothetical protein Nepgr_029485 [Nepenthes gracilis]|uniref:Uncharacterized protein n=1 Tax=Nepenthes gracilis TaxID=150966 RepID=A0AAD3Y320_NEPGR|nr:hypothetical protein Nepgr_029485 [Nepenthes gracilis]